MLPDHLLKLQENLKPFMSLFKFPLQHLPIQKNFYNQLPANLQTIYSKFTSFNLK